MGFPIKEKKMSTRGSAQPINLKREVTNRSLQMDLQDSDEFLPKRILYSYAGSKEKVGKTGQDVIHTFTNSPRCNYCAPVTHSNKMND